MGAARLLAKGWIAFCLFAGAHAMHRALAAYVPAEQVLSGIGVCVVLFCAMGLLFVGGYGVAAGLGGISRLRPRQLAPGFNEIVFAAFAVAIFFVQVAYAPGQGAGGALGALEAAIRFAVPGQRALEATLSACALDGGRSFVSAFTWLLAFVFLGSALSRLRLAAALVRLERKKHPEALGAVPLTFALGLAAVVGIQLLFIGSAYRLVPCDVISDITGSVLIGLGPLALAYLVAAALTNLLAINPEA